MDPYYVSNNGFAGHAQVGALELRRDHGVLRELLLRFECTDEAQPRRELVQLAADLFEVHSAIEAQAERGENEYHAVLSRQCEALRSLLVGAGAAATGSVELRQALDAYLASEESLPESGAPLSFRRDADNLHLLRQRARLLDYAEQLLRTH
jgi:hypothetical protein